MMMDFEWSDEKNRRLREERGVCFEDVVISIESSKLLDIVKNPSADRESQYCLIVEIGNYAYVVPFIKNDPVFFLKTVYPSRKQTKKYLKENV
jgi:uncharacterized DUF497 family protein